MKLKFVIDEDYDIRFSNKIELANYMKAIHKGSRKYLEGSKRLYQKSWDEINDKFSDYIKKLTSYDWFYNVYSIMRAYDTDNLGGRPLRQELSVIQAGLVVIPKFS